MIQTLSHTVLKKFLPGGTQKQYCYDLLLVAISSVFIFLYYLCWYCRSLLLLNIFGDINHGNNPFCSETHFCESGPSDSKSIIDWCSGVVVVQCCSGGVVVQWCDGGVMVQWWCCGGVVVQWWCHGVVVVLWWCCGVVVVSWCSGGVVVSPVLSYSNLASAQIQVLHTTGWSVCDTVRQCLSAQNKVQHTFFGHHSAK